jgi:hypothetical protein
MMTRKEVRAAAKAAISRAMEKAKTHQPVGYWCDSFDRRGRPCRMFVPAK